MKYLSKDDALKKMQKFCAYQDRCHKEVRSKLLKLGVYGDTLEEVIMELILEKFLDEERFARSFVRGKFRIKRWGKNRILRELKMRNVSPYCIKKGMEEIEADIYLKTLEEVLVKKNRLLKEPNEFKRRNKLAQYAIGRGFEPNLVWEEVKKMEMN